MTSGYRELGPDGKVPSYAYPSPTPETKGSQYQENTPTFESLQSGNAGRGVMGVQGFSRGKVEAHANGGMVGRPNPFEKSPADKERPGMAEGSPAEKAMDARQSHQPAPKKPNPPFKPFGTMPDATPR